MEYRKRKMQHLHDNFTGYSWAIFMPSRKIAVEFHGRKFPERKDQEFLRMNRFNFTTSRIEVHRSTPIYEGQGKIEGCIIMGGDCYTTGSSLYAEERLGHVNPDDCDEEVWGVLMQKIHDERWDTEPTGETA